MQVCPSGFLLYQGTCYGACPINTAPANEDPTKCVSQATCASLAPAGTLINDNVFDLVCNKIGTAKVGTCAAGYTEWQTGTCYINCPSGLLENGLTCLKRPIARQFQNPACDTLLYWYSGTSCTFNPLAILFIVCIIAAFLWLCKRSSYIEY